MGAGLVLLRLLVIKKRCRPSQRACRVQKRRSSALSDAYGSHPTILVIQYLLISASINLTGNKSPLVGRSYNNISALILPADRTGQDRWRLRDRHEREKKGRKRRHWWQAEAKHHHHHHQGMLQAAGVGWVANVVWELAGEDDSSRMGRIRFGLGPLPTPCGRRAGRPHVECMYIR